MTDFGHNLQLSQFGPILVGPSRFWSGRTALRRTALRPDRPPAGPPSAGGFHTTTPGRKPPSTAYFKDVRFYPILNLGHFWASPSPLTFHNVNNDGQSILGGAEGGPRKRRTRGNITMVIVFFFCENVAGRKIRLVPV